MTFSIIGAGNIAWFFGSRLLTARHHCTGVYARNTERAEKLAETLLVARHGSIDRVTEQEPDVCFLTVSDSGISDVAAKLSFKNTILIHTAGAVSIDAIKAAAKERAVLWPVYSITRNNPPGHRNIPCAWEASSPKAKRYVLEMGNAISDNLFEAKYDQRKWLHISAVIGNNFVNHLLTICEQICADNQIPFSVVLPIIQQTFERITHTSPGSLQTGPAIRNDTSTIKSQMELLAEHPSWQRIYKDITESIQAKMIK